MSRSAESWIADILDAIARCIRYRDRFNDSDPVLQTDQALNPERVLILPDGVEDIWNEEYADLVELDFEPPCLVWGARVVEL